MEISRRGFMAGAASTVFAGWLASRTSTAGAAEPVPPAIPAAAPRSPVALIQGSSRADNVLQILKRIEPQVREGLAKKKRVIIKPNLVNVDRPLTATHAECVEGILEFLSPLVKDEIIIAETPANGTMAEALSNYGYERLRDKYRVRFLDPDQQPFETEYVVDERYHPKSVRYSTVLLDPDAYYVTTAPFKTHDRAVVTLGLKNFVVGGIIKDVGYRWGAGSRGVTDKHIVHGGPHNEAINYNLFKLAQRTHPHLSVLDGFQGMEHNGPVNGTPVDHHVAVASTDWLAADRVAAELMGFDHHKIGYLVFCAQAGMGQTEPDQLEILGPSIPELARPYQPNDTVEEQYKWM